MEINKLTIAKALYAGAIILLIVSSIKSSLEIALIALAIIFIAMGLALWHFSYLFMNPSSLAEKLLIGDDK